MRYVSSLIAVVSVGAVGCRRLDPVPEDLDGAAAWLFRYQDADDAEAIVEAMDRLSEAFLPEVRADGFVEGLLAPLDAEAVAAVGRTAVESLSAEERAGVTEVDLDAGTYVVLADQQGLVVASLLPCRVEDAVEVFVRTDQDAIHDGYDAYVRRYTSDREAFDAGGLLTWETTYTVSVLTATYEATLLGQMRWLDPERTHALARAHLPEPGVFTRGGRYFRQDYQLDLFVETEADETLHVFAVWRDMNIAGIHSSNAAYIATVTDAFRQGDEEIAAVCGGA